MPMPTTTTEPWYDIEWKDDFKEKKYCHISLVRIVGRYYPKNDSQNEKPSCRISLYLGQVEIASHDLYADTEAQVKAAAEEWVSTTANAVRAAILASFNPATP
ncbi:hypothetical protein OIU34_19095 [Pararhizobium sp. BT-229]|uniref:hypothetical protein n=1 Tax=Pararhizobium sp. BT-229 TaxID=2986923 RepID=UPI0021F6E017|nr:hypothetical protein [Pararhizobium sp. BT-229]MCV9963989.1 hypothetical protein [Pararhizobium sp. BT-229]